MKLTNEHSAKGTVDSTVEVIKDNTLSSRATIARLAILLNERDEETKNAAIAELDALLSQRDALYEALNDCDKAFAGWQCGQIPGRPEDILALICKVRSALSLVEKSKC